MWAESRVGLEAMELLQSRVFRGVGVEDAGGQPVMLIPGFLAGDNSLGLMTGWLRRTGHRTKRAGIRFNVDCSGRALGRLEQRLDALAESSGQRVAIVGQSRGGTFARAMAVHRPDLVSGIVCLGSPLLDPLAINILTRTGVFLVGALGTLGAPGMFGARCRNGNCCESFWETVRAPFPPDVGYVSLYSRTDGVVDYRACLDPAARRVRIESSHIGMSVNSVAYRRVAGALAEFRRAEARIGEPLLGEVA
jgi:pimeloyl-ACP methyl ester carboxylesterase